MTDYLSSYDGLHRKDWDGSSLRAGPVGSSPTFLPSRWGALLGVDRGSLLNSDQYLASFFEGQVTVASGHDSTLLHFFASELSSFPGRNTSCCDFKQLFPRLAGVALHYGTGE